MNAAPPNLDRFPADLKSLRRWVSWRYEGRNGKTTKRPMQSVANERAWLSLSDACGHVSRGVAQGVGFVLGAGVVGIDLDDCIASDGTLHDVARNAIETLDTYTERSPSGRGLHVFIRGTIEKPMNIRKCAGMPGRELYDGRQGSARFFTVTGDCVGGVTRLANGSHAQARLNDFVAKWFVGEPPTCRDDEDDALLQVMFAAKDGARWRALYGGDHSRYPSLSEADIALCGKLRFYTRGNAAQMDRIFRSSGLMRPKWNEGRGAGQTYGERTIGAALTKGGPVYAARSVDGAAAIAAKERSAWAKVPAWWIVRLKGAGELAFRTLLFIASYADSNGEAFPSIQTIAAHCRVSERHVKSAIATLRKAGLLTSEQRARQSNLYRLALRVPEVVTPYAALREASRVPSNGHLGCPGHGTVTDQELTIVNTGERQDKTSAAEIGVSQGR